MPYRQLWEIGSKKVDPPHERSLQILYSPNPPEASFGLDKDRDITVLMSTIYPHGGQTGIHTHEVDEIIFVTTGRGKGVEGDETFDIQPGTVIYAPAGVEHDCRNLSDQTMQMVCIYSPALPSKTVKGIMQDAQTRV